MRESQTSTGAQPEDGVERLTLRFPEKGSSAHVADITAVLLGHSGVVRVEILDPGTLTLTYDPALASAHAMKGVIEGAGYKTWLPVEDGR